MFSSSVRSLLLSLSLFVLAGTLILLGLERGGGRLVGAGIAALCLSAAMFSVGAVVGRRKRDPLQRRRDQRLWKSGPLGRRWLEGRRRIP